MGTVGIDHLAMPTANAEALIAFYKKLGFEINDEAEWRAGEASIFSIQAGDSKINVHPEGFTASLRGDTALPGSADICFVWAGAVYDSAVSEQQVKHGLSPVSMDGIHGIHQGTCPFRQATLN